MLSFVDPNISLSAHISRERFVHDATNMESIGLIITE